MEIHVVQTDDALVCRGSEWDDMSSGWLELWTDERPDGDDTSSGREAGNRLFLTCKQCRNSGTILNSGIPVKSIFTYK
jgi:hypothetical protein